MISTNLITYLQNMESLAPQPLTFKIKSFPTTPSENDNKQKTAFFDFDIFPDIVGLLKDNRLYDVWVILAVELALQQTFNSQSLLTVVPTHVRHFADGRCDPTYIANKATNALINFVKTINVIDLFQDPEKFKNGLPLFCAALEALKAKIRNTKMGAAIGTHIGVIRRMLPKEQHALKNMLEIFAAPSVVITGNNNMKNFVNFGTGNVYTENQLCINYLGDENSVRFTFRAVGTFANKLDELQINLQKAMKVMLLYAVKLGIIKQMNATNVILNSAITNKNDDEKFALAIHGGAGEITAMPLEMISIVNFALRVAVLIGIDSLQKTQNATVVVEATVKALEDCFIFNAGKGSVFNVNGEHELEATIMDGSTGKAGAVACIRNLKNPISAATKIMKEFGAVALDQHGRLAAATSTGGLINKAEERIGDTAVIGAATWADKQVAISCTGDGEVFLRKSVASKIAFKYDGDLYDTCNYVIEQDLNDALAGVVAIDAKGNVVSATNSQMFYGSYSNGKITTKIEGMKNIEDNNVQQKSINKIIAPKSWVDPIIHSKTAITDSWYTGVFKLRIYESMFINCKILHLPETKPLLGIPFTIKDTFAVKGFHHTSGIYARRNTIANYDSNVVKNMKDAGAILLAITNVSEAAYWVETNNRIYGRTRNPYDTRRIAGGSSGGEGALIGAGGSLIGIGSDFAGSVRIPSIFNGIYGLKPSENAVSLNGHHPCFSKGFPKSMMSIGPLCRYAKDLSLVFRVMTGNKTAENSLSSSKTVETDKIRFFYMNGFNSFMIEPLNAEVTDAINKTIKYFEKRFHTSVYHINFLRLHHAISHLVASCTETKELPIAHMLNEKEEDISVYKEIINNLFGHSNFTVPSLIMVLLDRSSEMNPETRKFIEASRDKLRQEIIDLLSNNGILIFPSWPIPAPFHNQPIATRCNTMYTGIWNVLRLPAIVCPIGFNQNNIPLSVQLIASPNNDQLLIDVASDLEKHFCKWQPPKPILNGT